MADRYFVDERAGCVAVRDRENTDPDYNGLHEDTEGVVRYWHGKPVSDVCKECGHTTSFGWTVSEEDVKAAHELCAKLNKQAS